MDSRIMSTGGSIVLGVSLAVVAYLVRKHLRTRSQLSYPPGPPPRVLFGNMPDMPKERHSIAFQKWGNLYGPLTYLSMPGRPILVLNSYEVVMDLLDKRGSIYSERPSVPMANLIGVDTSTALLPFGPTWKRHRRFLASALNPSVVKRNYAGLQEQKAYEYLTILLERPQDCLGSVRRITGEVVTQIAYGAYRDDERNFVEMNEENFSPAITGKYLVNFFPWLRWVPAWMPGAQFKRDASRMRKAYTGARDYLYNYVVRRKASNLPLPPSYVSHLLQENPNPSQEVQDAISRSAVTFYRAGTDTTEFVIKSFLRAMTLYPEVQAKAHDELDRVIGRDRPPSLNDMDDLPYISAIALEALRWNPPSSNGVPHRVAQDDTYNGYFIPAGTTVIANIWGISQDPKYFPSPSEFYPDRYCESNSPALDPREFVFGFGRRICPGILLAHRAVWINVASILWGFSIRLDDSPRPKAMDVTQYMDLNQLSAPYPFACDVTPRWDGVAEKVAEAIAERTVE